MSLWYQFHKICNGCVLNIYQTFDKQRSLIFTENGSILDQFNTWINISVDVHGKGPFKIILEADFTNTTVSAVRYILIDDISIAYRPCRGKFQRIIT